MNAKTLIAVSLAVSLSAGGALADRYDDHDEYIERARVLKVIPIERTVEVTRPEERCYTEKVYHTHRDRTGTIVGGIIGGVLGYQIGRRTGGKAPLTAAGVVAGGAIGAHHDRHHGHDGARHAHTKRRCEVTEKVVDVEKEVVGYRVKYEHNGRTYWTRTDEDPGDYIQVDVRVSPAYDD